MAAPFYFWREGNYTDGWMRGKKWMEGKEEGTVCSAWKWKFGVGRVKKNTVWGAGGGYCICADEPEMTFTCRRYRNRFFQGVGMNVQGGGKCQSICSSVHFKMSGRLKSELCVSCCAINIHLSNNLYRIFFWKRIKGMSCEIQLNSCLDLSHKQRDR